MTLIYIGVMMLYVGKKDTKLITYQSIWGMSPASRDRRYWQIGIFSSS